MEKAYTTPDAYPLTLKATITGCNQKSNRDPIREFNEGQVQDALDQLREDGLVAEVFTDGGRAPRYRHHMRHKFDFSESQLAIIAELLLRGRQQPGELRTRASRMVRIDGQDQLRQELSGLQEKGYLQSNGPLDRRGVEVDHTFYSPSERMDLGNAPASAENNTGAATENQSQPETPASTAAVDNSGLESSLDELKSIIREQAETISGLESLMTGLDDRLQKLERDLGV